MTPGWDSASSRRRLRDRVYSGAPARPGAALSPRQAEVYAWYYARTRETGIQPSFRETGLHFGVVVNAIFGFFLVLADKGWIQLTGRRRGVQFLRRPDGTPFRGFCDLEENIHAN